MEPEPVHGAMLHHPFGAALVCALLQLSCPMEDLRAVPPPMRVLHYLHKAKVHQAIIPKQAHKQAECFMGSTCRQGTAEGPAKANEPVVNPGASPTLPTLEKPELVCAKSQFYSQGYMRHHESRKHTRNIQGGSASHTSNHY